MDDGFDEVIAEFLVESYENIDRLDQDLLALEGNPEDPSTLASAFRTVHTIKGTCGFLGYGRLERVTHVGENLLSQIRDGKLRLDSSRATALLAMVDAVRAMLTEIEASGTDGEEPYDDLVEFLTALKEPDSLSQAVAADLDEPLEVDEIAPLGSLLVAAGAAIPGDIALALTEQGFGDSRPIGKILIDHGVVEDVDVDRAVFQQQMGETARSSISESNIRVDVGVLDQLMNLVGELVLSRNNIMQHVGATSEPAIIAASQQLHMITGELQECVMKTRMQPIGSVWSKFTRVVRDLSNQCGKQVRIEMEGEDTELDKTILEAIKDPLTHVMRNTVDHGIETPEVRAAAGKPTEGVLHLRAFHEGGQVIIHIADDGAGIDASKVMAKAVSQGLVSEADAAAMSEREAVNLIFSPGFSTAESVTNVSGRGVGMDVVKTNIERIGGTVDVETQLGSGTTLTIRIPLTLAIVPAVMVESAGERYAIPQIEVQELVRLDREHAIASIEMLHNAPVYRLRGDLLPLVYLRDQFGHEPIDDESAITIAVVVTDGRSWGLVVDGVSSTEEIVVKPLGSLMRSIHAFSGATIRGDGRIALILDTAGIARHAQVVATAKAVLNEFGSATTEQAGATSKVLVVARGEERLGIDLTKVDRLEQFDPDLVEHSDHFDVIQYRDGILPLVSLSPGTPPSGGRLVTIVFDRGNSLVGLVVDRIIDIVEAPLGLNLEGPRGSIIVRDRVTEMLDIDASLSPAAVWVGRNLTEVGV